MTMSIEKKEKTNIKPESIEDQKRAVNKFSDRTINIMNELRFSAGKTTRSISDAVLIGRRVASSTLSRMKSNGLVERIFNFGWRITSYGSYVLKILFNNNNNNYDNTSTTTTQHTVNTKNEITTVEPEKQNENAPSCFSSTTCHIRTCLKKTVYNMKTMFACDGCCQYGTDIFDLKSGLWRAVRIST